MEKSKSKRARLLRQLLARAGADALVVTHLPNILYLSGFSGTAGVLVVQSDRLTLFTDGRYAIQAREEAHKVRVCISRGPLLKAVGGHLRKWGAARAAFEPQWLSVAEKRTLQRAVGKRIRWFGLENGVAQLREVKDAEEISQIRRAARLGCEVFAEVLAAVKPGVRELELAAEIEYRMRRKGASGLAFPTIVASGARSALPHAQPSQKRLRGNELVVLDLGAILGHYCCDLTRTVYLGRAPAKVRGWYRAVQEAQDEARAALQAGVAAGKVDVAARRVLKRFGIEQHFIHSTGHGLGLEVHEEPRLAKGQEKIIQAGNVVTLEPGVYVEGIGGIRIEDDIAVLRRGTESLTNAPREFIEL